MMMLMTISRLPTNERLTSIDPWLAPFKDKLLARLRHTVAYTNRLLGDKSIYILSFKLTS